MSRKVHIAVLDDGIFFGKYQLQPLRHSAKIENGVLQPSYQNPERKTSHGTVCAAIIHLYAPEAELSSIKVIFGEKRTGNPDDLIAAIDWCLTHQVDLVHLSIGTVESRDFHKIGAKIHEAAKQGLLFVAAQSNSRQYTYPACLSDVIGVSQRPIYQRAQFRMNRNALNCVEISASSVHELPLLDGSFHSTAICNSFAAPLITAKAAGFLEKAGCPLSKEELCGLLAKDGDCLAKTPYDPYFQVLNDCYAPEQVAVLRAEEVNQPIKGDKRYLIFEDKLNQEQRKQVISLHRRYLEPGEYESRLHMRQTAEETELPTVSIDTGDTQLDEQLASLLEQAIYTQSYYPVVLSSWIKDAGRGWFFCPAGWNPYRVACTLARDIRPDILVLCSLREDRADIRVHRTDGSFVIESEEGEQACPSAEKAMEDICGLIFEDE